VIPTHILIAICLTCVIGWTALSASVFANRVMFDRRRRKEALDAVHLSQGSLPGPRLRPLALGRAGATASAAASALVETD